MFFKYWLGLLFAAFAALLSIRSPGCAAELQWERRNNLASIWIEGPIVAGDAKQFQELVLSLIERDLVVLMVTIYSNGGLVDEALRIGRQIRLLGAETYAPKRIGKRTTSILCDRVTNDHDGKKLAQSQHWSRGKVSKTFQDDRTPNVRCNCASACFLIWAGGVGRFGNYIGVHSITTKVLGKMSLKEAQDYYEDIQKEQGVYFREMGVPEAVANKINSATSEDIVFLTDQEVLAMNNGRTWLAETLIQRCGGVKSAWDGMKAAIRMSKEQRMAYLNKIQADLDRKIICEDQVFYENGRPRMKEYLEKYGNK